MPARPQKKQVEDAIKALNSVRRNWLLRTGVTAVDVGFKIKGDKVTDEVALRMHVRRKLPLGVLEAHEAATTKKDEKIGGFPIDVIEAEYEPAEARPATAGLIELEAVDRRSRVDPLVGGVSCGNPRITAGTIGAIVFDRATGDPCILSNWHVLVGSITGVAGEPILQPGTADGGTASDKVANLLRFRLDRDMDAALARLDGSRGHSRDIVGLAPIPGIDAPALGMQVTKSGRTTAVTKAVIDGVSMSISINYGDAGIKTLHDQIHMVPRPPWPAVDVEISMGGDSGSVWVNDGTGRAVGLHFAGETSTAPRDENAVANRMEVVADELNFSFTPLVRPVRPIDDDRLRDLIRLLICRRFPFLCRPRPIPRGPGSEVMPQAGGVFGTDGAPYQAADEGVEALVDEILAAMR